MSYLISENQGPCWSSKHKMSCDFLGFSEVSVAKDWRMCLVEVSLTKSLRPNPIPLILNTTLESMV